MAEAATKPAAEKQAVVKPERPDEEAYKANLAKADKELKVAEERIKSIKAKLDNLPNNKDSPSAKKRAELLAELKDIRTQQGSAKTGRSGIQEKIKRLDEKLKLAIAENKNNRSKVQFKSVEDVQQEINRLQKQVDTGTMKLVDEKKALDDISKLNRIKKSFGGLEESQKGIDALKAEIAEQRKLLDDPEAKALSDRYNKIQAELDTIKAEQDEAFKNVNALRDERKVAQEDQQKKYLAKKEIQDAYYAQRRAARDYEQEARRIRDEKRRAENDAYHRGRRQEAAKSKLDDASAPAYDEEIRVARSVLAHFDPSSVAKQEASGPGKFAAAASRKIDDAGIKGTALKKKGEDEDDNYFIGGGGKKKKGRKGAAAATTTEKFNLDLGTIDSLARIGVDPPMSQADVPSVVEKIKEKLEFWKGDQDRKTKENIAAAQAEIDKLEAEAESAPSESRKSAAQKQVNGSAAAAGAENDAVADVTQDLEKAKVDDKIDEKAPRNP